MALQINRLQIEAVNFGGFKTVPHMTQEKKLRVSNIKLALGREGEAMDVLASCFGDDETTVRDFMEKNMNLTDLARLQAYLLGGDDAVAALESRMKTVEDKQIDRVLDQIERERERGNE